jgi:hypothetical protein
MDIVWEPIDQYITFLEKSLGFDSTYHQQPVDNQENSERILSIVKSEKPQD